MASVDSDVGSMQHAVKDALSTHWRLYLFQGVIIIILGVVAVVVPVATTIAVEIFLGWLFLVSGITGLVAMFATNNVPAFLWSLITAALSVAIGIMLIWNPVAGTLAITLVLTAFFIAEGVFQTMTSIVYRDVMGGQWSWLLVSGISDLLLAVIIILGWPITAAWTLGLLVGINLITSGWAIVMAALAGRNLTRTVTDSLAAAARH